MARVSFAALAILAAALSVAGGGASRSDSCHRLALLGPSSLPASVVLTTTRGRFELRRDGRVCDRGRRPLPVPPATNWFPSDLSWYRLEHGHLLIGRGHRVLWRSQGRFSHEGVGEIALSRDRLAFSFFANTSAKTPSLYLVRPGGTERPVARGETPIGWTRTGTLVTLSSRGGVLRARSATGRLEGTLARRVSIEVLDRSTAAVLFVTRGTLERFDGLGVRRLARLADYGLSARPTLTPLGSVVAVQDPRRLAIFRTDGSLVSATNLPHSRKARDALSGGLAANDAGDVAFTAAHGSFETVNLLPRGAGAAQSIYREHVYFAICERWAGLSWRGSWLLYASSEGYAAAVDVHDPSASIDLSALARRLPGMGGEEKNFDAGWSTVGSD
jgi:hypothetical protein